jgi:hypothetical protein
MAKREMRVGTVGSKSGSNSGGYKRIGEGAKTTNTFGDVLSSHRSQLVIRQLPG